jgi:molybdenum cofactor synthesis domain-containing protein
MKAGILAVGSELLGSDRLDTNSLRLTEVLERHGVALVGKQVVGDDVERIGAAVAALAAAADLVLVTGGLGPTADDVTREAVSRVAGRVLREDPAIVADIRRKFESFGRPMPSVNRRQGRDGGADALDVVADHLLPHQGHAVPLQDLGEPERVGIEAVGAEQLRPDGEDAGLHPGIRGTGRAPNKRAAR